MLQGREKAEKGKERKQKEQILWRSDEKEEEGNRMRKSLFT